MANENSWKKNTFRQTVIAKLEDAIKKSEKVVLRNSTEIEKDIFLRARNKKEYISIMKQHISEIENGTLLNSPRQQSNILTPSENLAYQKKLSKFIEPLNKEIGKGNITDIELMRKVVTLYDLISKPQQNVTLDTYQQNEILLEKAFGQNMPSTEANVENEDHASSEEQDSNSSDELSPSDEEASDNNERGSDSDGSTRGNTPIPAEQSISKGNPPIEEEEPLENIDVGDHPMSQDNSRVNSPGSEQSSSTSDNETDSDVECSQKSPPMVEVASSGSDSDSEHISTQCSQVVPVITSCPPTPQIWVKPDLFSPTASPAQYSAVKSQAARAINFKSPLQNTYTGHSTSGMQANVIESPYISNNITNEAGLSTSQPQFRNEELRQESSPATASGMNSGVLPCIVNERIPSNSEERIPPLIIRFKPKNRMKNRRGYYTGENLRRLYFKQKLEIARFELHSKKVLHKLECAIKRRQLDQMERMSVN